MNESTPIIVSPLLHNRFVTAFKSHQVLLFHAPCGCGKTTVACELLKQYKVRYISAFDDGFLQEQGGDNSRVLLVDDLQMIKSDTDKATLCEMIHAQKYKHFVLLSRGTVPGW